MRDAREVAREVAATVHEFADMLMGVSHRLELRTDRLATMASMAAARDAEVRRAALEEAEKAARGLLTQERGAGAFAWNEVLSVLIGELRALREAK